MEENIEAASKSQLKCKCDVKEITIFPNLKWQNVNQGERKASSVLGFYRMMGYLSMRERD